MEASLNSARSLGARTVHIKMYPTARTFSERREVLRVLERFGEVNMFRSLKYYPRAPVSNAFLSMFNTESAAKDAVNASPIRYRLISEPSQSTIPYTTSPDSLPSEDAEANPTKTKPAEEDKVFELHVSTSDFDHTLYLTNPMMNPLRGPFKPIDSRYSYIAGALDRSVPKSLWAAGLKDWETDSVKRRNGAVLGQEQALETGERTMGVRVKHVVAQRERQRKEKALPKVMRGLRALREEREREIEHSTGKEQG